MLRKKVAMLCGVVILSLGTVFSAGAEESTEVMTEAVTEVVTEVVEEETETEMETETEPQTQMQTIEAADVKRVYSYEDDKISVVAVLQYADAVPDDGRQSTRPCPQQNGYESTIYASVHYPLDNIYL